ncbi:hypothetical protein H1R20_g11697, partial [Candolleomyces eurysporus]
MTHQSKRAQISLIDPPHPSTAESIGQYPVKRRPTNFRCSNISMAQGKIREDENGRPYSSHVRDDNPSGQYIDSSPPLTATGGVIPSDSPVPVLTEAWIYEDDVFEELQCYMKAIFAYMKEHNVSFPPAQPSQKRGNPRNSARRKRSSGDHWEEGEHAETPQDLAPVVLVLEFRLTGRVGYYFVDHPSQTLFWLEHFDFTYMLMEMRGEWTDWLVGLQMKSHYWYHNELFPHLYELVEDDIHEIDDVVGYAMGDALTSSRTTVNWTPDILKHLQTMVHRYEQKDPMRRRRSVGERRTICRIFSSFYDERFLNLYGDKAARLSSTQSVHYSEHRRKKFRDTAAVPDDTAKKPWYRRIANAVLPRMWPWRSADEGNKDVNSEDVGPPIDAEARDMQRNSPLLNIFSSIMFGGPGIHMQRLRELTVDRMVRKHGFEKYVEKMVEEWRDITLYATVILSANVSFLTIQSVDEAGSAGDNRTNSQRASYFSILASMGTIVFSLLLLRQHRERISYEFVANRAVSRWGLESLAIMMVSFFTSFAILWYKGKDNIVISVVSISCFIFLAILAWGAAAAYETDQYEAYVVKVAKKTEKVGKKVGNMEARARANLTAATYDGPPTQGNASIGQ